MVIMIGVTYISVDSGVGYVLEGTIMLKTSDVSLLVLLLLLLSLMSSTCC